MSRPAPALAPPDPAVTARLVGRALSAPVRPGAALTLVSRALAAGIDLAALGSDPARLLLADAMTLARAGMAVEDLAPLLAGWAVGIGLDARVGDLDRALAAGAAVTAVLAEAVHPAAGGEPVAVPTVAVLGAATCAGVMAAATPARLAAVLDLAATLMVLTPPAAQVAPAGQADSDEAILWAAHSALAGWLAAQLPDAGFVEVPGSLAHTMAAALGRDARLPSEQPADRSGPSGPALDPTPLRTLLPAAR